MAKLCALSKIAQSGRDRRSHLCGAATLGRGWGMNSHAVKCRFASARPEPDLR